MQHFIRLQPPAKTIEFHTSNRKTMHLRKNTQENLQRRGKKPLLQIFKQADKKGICLPYFMVNNINQKQIIGYIRTPPLPHYNVGNVHDFAPENAFVENTNTQHCIGGAGVCNFSVMKYYILILSMTVDLKWWPNCFVYIELKKIIVSDFFLFLIHLSIPTGDSRHSSNILTTISLRRGISLNFDDQMSHNLGPLSIVATKKKCSAIVNQISYQTLLITIRNMQYCEVVLKQSREKRKTSTLL